MEWSSGNWYEGDANLRGTTSPNYFGLGRLRPTLSTPMNDHLASGWQYGCDWSLLRPGAATYHRVLFPGELSTSLAQYCAEEHHIRLPRADTGLLRWCGQRVSGETLMWTAGVRWDADVDSGCQVRRWCGQRVRRWCGQRRPGETLMWLARVIFRPAPEDIVFHRWVIAWHWTPLLDCKTTCSVPLSDVGFPAMLKCTE